MTDKCFVDTNILIYAYDNSAGHKHETALGLVKELWSNRAGVLSTQVLQELVVNLAVKYRGRIEVEDIKAIVADLMMWDLFVNDGQSCLNALDLMSRYRISFWDALIVNAAVRTGATVIYSEDLSDGQFYDGVRVINPLKKRS